MEIIPTTAAIWFVLPFIVTVCGLYVLLFKPFYAYLEARDAHTVGARDEASQLVAATEHKIHTLESKLAVAREAAVATRAAAREQALTREVALVAATREHVAEQIKAELVEVTAEASRARSQLKQDAVIIAAEVAGQLLGREVRA